jgi:putative DNA primase/helicase
MEPLTAEHCATYQLPVNPDFDSPYPLFSQFLNRLFLGEDAEARRMLLQEIVGGIITMHIARLQVAVLFYGAARTAKSTMAQIIAALLPPRLVTATAPTRWSQEYYIASLAGKVLNLVGELSALQPIPAQAFKQVLGLDMIQGRMPNHQPFEFWNTAAHLFVSNFFPPTEDRSDGFFRRWIILPFDRSLTADDVVPEYHKTLMEQELPQILAWALRGAERLQRRGRLPESSSHDAMLRKWRLAGSSVLEFLNDDQVCRLDRAKDCRQSHLYAAYSAWCETAGRKRIGRNTFLEEIESTGAILGVMRKRRREADVVEGVELVGNSFMGM